MDIVPNSRKLNGISLAECITNEMTEEKSALVRSPRIDQTLVKRYNNRRQNINPVSKSLKSFFKKLRGTPTTSTNTTTNKSLYLSPSTNTTSASESAVTSVAVTSAENIILVPSRSSHSKYNNKGHQSKKKKVMIAKSLKNYHLPAIVTTNDENFRRKVSSSYHRHTLDLSYTIVDYNTPIRRSNSLFNNNSSIFTTFTPLSNDIPLSPSACSINSIETVSSFSSSSSSYSQKSNSDHDIQKRLWDEDETLCAKREIAEWLGSKPETRANVLYLYMNNFEFSNQRLDEAFRTLCSKLFLKGESQQLDRIIEAFAKRYYDCNPTTLLHCIDVVYAVAYSLLLLNTDLHVVSDWANKMTRSNFVKNTMETIQSLVFPHIMLDDFSKQRKRRASNVSHQSKSSSESLYQMKRIDSSSRSIILEDALKSNISLETGLTRTQKVWLGDIESLLKDMYTAVKSNGIDQAKKQIPQSTSTINLYRSRTLPKNDAGKTPSSFRRRRGQSVINPLDNKLSFSVSELKQGLVMRKHVMESTDKRARNRQWQLCYLVMNGTELVMHRPVNVSQQQNIQQTYDQKARRRRSMMLWNQSVCSLQDILSHGGGAEDWQADQEGTPLGILEMNHTYTSAIPPPGWNGQRPHVFRMETADGGLWLFESTDMFAIQAWVEAANITAAKISKGPMTGAVCNIDYGWGAKWDNTTTEFTTETVPVWYPPTPCMIKSTLDMNYQYYDFEAQITNLNEELARHRGLKMSLDKKFSPGNNHGLNSMQALTNWDRKLQFILHELVKLKCYKESLHQSLT